MNKQEALKRIEAQKETLIKLTGWAVYIYIEELIKSIDEPHKVTIPQVIAEYIEQKKDDDYHLLGAMIEIRSHKNKEIDEWFEFKEDDNMETFARAWIDGYEVEKEKRYRVEMKGISSLFRHLKYNLLTEKWYMGNDTENEEVKKTHTRKQLEEAGFGWVFDCEGLEVEEVTE